MQREVLGLLLSAVEPANLALSEPLLVQLTPTPGNNLEDLSSDAAFDHLKAARILSALVLEPLLEADRAARLVMFADRQTGALTLPELVQAMLTATWKAPRDADPRHRSLRRVTQRVALDSMMILGGSDDASPESRAYILDQLIVLGAELGEAGRSGSGDRRALPAVRARHHSLSREPESERAALGVSLVGRPSAFTVPAAAGPAARRRLTNDEGQITNDELREAFVIRHSSFVLGS